MGSFFVGRFINTKKRTPALYMARAAVIAAMYAALTYIVQPLAFAAVQFRLSEALTVLPFFLPEAISGLFVGCVISNLLSPHFVLLDVIFGGGATLLAAYLTSRCKNKWLAPLPPVIINAIVISFVISVSASGSDSFAALYFLNFLYILLSQFAVCYGLGIPLIIVLGKFLPAKTNKNNKKPSLAERVDNE